MCVESRNGFKREMYIWRFCKKNNKKCSKITIMFRQLILVLKGIGVFYNDLKFFIENSNIDHSNNTKAKLLSTLIASYHIVEKGLSMPNRRLGFGKEAVMALSAKCSLYAQKYGDNNDQFRYAISILKEYDDLHKQYNFTLDVDLQKSISDLIEKYNIPAARQNQMTKDEFFAYTESSFDKFSVSRHSTRHFGGSIETAKIIEYIK